MQERQRETKDKECVRGVAEGHRHAKKNAMQEKGRVSSRARTRKIKRSGSCGEKKIAQIRDLGQKKIYWRREKKWAEESGEKISGDSGRQKKRSIAGFLFLIRPSSVTEARRRPLARAVFFASAK